jgi:hypothetical protein
MQDGFCCTLYASVRLALFTAVLATDAAQR